MKLKTAVFPVAGMGTRFLPATKANPKEMLTIVDKPLIQYAVEEALEALRDEDDDTEIKIIFVTNLYKRSIEDHFDTNYELEARLEEAGKHALLKEVRDILPRGVTVAYVRQSHPAGLGHAVLCAKRLVGDEPFAILLADDLINTKGSSCLKQMADVFHQQRNSVLAVERIDPSQTNRYGVVDIDSEGQDLGRIKAIVEKPEPKDAPSNLAVVGRYILTPAIFPLLEKTKPGKGGEIQLTDAIAALLALEKVSTLEFKGKRYDCGNKLGYLEANIVYALLHDEVGKDFQEILKKYQGDIR